MHRGMIFATAVALMAVPSEFQPVQTTTGLALFGYAAVDYLIPLVGKHFVKRGLFGKDLSKIGRPIIPESIGVIPAVTYLFVMFFSIPFLFPSKGSNSLLFFLGSMLSLESMILLGLMDDLFDIRWRHKFFLPAIASIPLLIVYRHEFNETSILLPKFMASYFETSPSFNLGIFYYFYMAAVSIFCPNSINILAGINGLEVGQTIIITILLLLNDIYYIIGYYNDVQYRPAYEIHLFSMCMLIPFLGIACSLFKYNKFPARVFVGDTWCYFSGMVFAVTGISGHFAKTLMLFFLPQIFNFLYSSPQLFGVVPCPRHRLPKFNEKDGLMYNSFTEYREEQAGDTKLPKLRKGLIPFFNLLEKLKLIKLVRNNKGEIIKSSNLTIINLVILWFGPKKEGDLCSLIMKLQFLIGFICLILRHTCAPIIFGFDNSWSMLNRFYT
ncbi:unnamed protein product [Pichia kudriavzevii]|uniref:UDP-N-acetylglucosamine--dolichyl-phosphate N-acetylglucosaminephosphotransferase n=1 Tax=Pichia kudriavzevii TaxID=4909 RepID=A0A099P253_PICKU|nr:hypothetical protein JL09_g2626 [Pichia kudriavzevii]